MKLNNPNIIYLLGAGRSGTTLIATVLNNNSFIHTLGEMHQFLEYIEHENKCSCGETVSDCIYWGNILNRLKNEGIISSIDYQQFEKKEKHKNIPKLLLKKNPDIAYLELHEGIFQVINESHQEQWVLDSSKYLARYLLLKRSNKLKIKGIYIVRDVRGVVTSFKKKVQTSRKPLSAIFYYLLINIFAQIISWTDKGVIKIRYEDFVQKPEENIKYIFQKALNFELDNFSMPDNFEMPHIIGGNRMKSNKQIQIRPDNKWKTELTRWEQIIYYVLAFPVMLINKYKV